MNIIGRYSELGAKVAVFILAGVLGVMANAGEGKQSGNTNDGEQAQKETRYVEPKLKNAWLEGKLETAFLLNRHLNNFTIDSEVRAGTAILNGKVESKIDRELAEQVALSNEGVHRVDNRLKVDAEHAKHYGKRHDGKERTFQQKFDDMTTTAIVKSKLLANGSTHGLAINVDTVNATVFLKGQVKTSEEKALAGKIAENVDGVVEVNNMLKIKS